MISNQPQGVSPRFADDLEPDANAYRLMNNAEPDANAFRLMADPHQPQGVSPRFPSNQPENTNPRLAPNLRVLIDRTRWLALAPAFYEEANRRLRANGLPAFKFQKNPSKPVPVHPSLGKELCVLCWAVEEAPHEMIPNALMNWEALAPEERWWLYTMTVATTGQAMHRGVGWRKALRAAIAENPFVKGEGSSPKARRELLDHSQLTLDFD